MYNVPRHCDKGRKTCLKWTMTKLDRLDMAPGLTLRSRLACQCVVKGDVDG